MVNPRRKNGISPTCRCSWGVDSLHWRDKCILRDIAPVAINGHEAKRDEDNTGLMVVVRIMVAQW